MKIEKRIIALCLCSLVVGIAITLPLTYFMPVNAVTGQKISSWFDIRMDYAYFSANVADDTYQQKYAFGAESAINFDAFNQQKGARIEYFEFIYYTDDLQLLKAVYFIGGNSSYIENPQDFVKLNKEKWFNSDGVNFNVAGQYSYDLSLKCSDIDPMLTIGVANIDTTKFDEYSAFLTAIEDKQTIYLDVRRAGYTTSDGNDIVINTSNSEVVIQRLELTKNGDAFIFGNEENIIAQARW